MSEWYEIRVKGHLAGRWAAWSGGMTLTPGDDGTTVQHGLIAAARGAGLPLISVNQLTRKESS